MKVFLSWSGQTSYNIAVALRDWLPYVIQSVKPFISSDIGKGQRWSEQLKAELDETAFGIICLTPCNLSEPWLNFEAGAISKAMEQTSVSPLLINVEPNQVSGPLQQFQFTRYEKEDVFGLLRSINAKTEPNLQLTQELLRLEFDQWWPTLETRLVKIIDAVDPEPPLFYKWLHNEGSLAKAQEAAKCNEVWVVTPNLIRYTVDSNMTELIQANLEKDVVYTFIFPSPSESDKATADLRRFFASKPDKLIISPERASDFRNLAATDYIILNPNWDPQHPLRVFLELPIVDQGYWIEVENDAAGKFVDRFRQLATELPAAKAAVP